MFIVRLTLQKEVIMRRLLTRKYISLLCAFMVMVGGAFSLADAAGQTASTSIVVKLLDGLTPTEQAAVIARDGGVETSSVPALRLHVISVPTSDLSLVQ